MAKIIVEDIQGGSTGDVLTIPQSKATLNNQPVVGSTTGVLSHSPVAMPAAVSPANNRPLVGATDGTTSFSPVAMPAAVSAANNRPLVGATDGTTSFSPVAMPAADGTANKPLTTDGSGQLQFGAFSLPNNSGSNGNFLGTDGTSASWVGPPTSPSLLSAEGLVYGTMVTTSAQGNSYSTGDWTSSGPWTTYRHDQFFVDTTSSTQGFNMLLGDGFPNATSTQTTYAGNQGYEDQRLIQYATGNRGGWSYKEYYYQDNNTSYGGLSWRVLPIRNTSSSAISINISALYSAYTTYSGASLGYFTPTNSSGTTYSTVTGGTWTQLQTSTSGINVWGTNSISVPANTTILVLLNTAHAYQTSYRFIDCSLFFNLHTTFSNANIICDLRMLYALHQARTPSAINTSANPEEIYTACATIFGDR